MELQIKVATEKDIPKIFAMIRELAEYEKLTHLIEGSEEQLREALFGSDSSVECIMAYLDEEPAGYAFFFKNFSTFQTRSGLYLEDIYVKKMYRGRGVGQALFKYVTDIARERGCGRLEWLVLAWNKQAIGFYKKMGAKVFEEFRLCRLLGDALEA